MKKTILPALAMLIVAAVMLSTASYAWFAISSNVTAEGMNVTIKSESEYLLIMPVALDFEAPEADTQEYQNVLTQIRTTNKYTATGTTTDSTDIYPAAHEADLTAADFATIGNWYTALGAKASESTIKENSKTVLTTYDKYVVRYKYLVSMAQGSTAKTGLWINSVDITSKDGLTQNQTINPVKVVVVCGDKFYECGYSNDGVKTPLPGGGQAGLFTGAINENVFYEIDVYVYYDGNHKDVFTDNFVNIDSAMISVSFTTTDPAAQQN